MYGVKNDLSNLSIMVALGVGGRGGGDINETWQHCGTGHLTNFDEVVSMALGKKFSHFVSARIDYRIAYESDT